MWKLRGAGSEDPGSGDDANVWGRLSEAHELREKLLREFREGLSEQEQGHEGSDEGNGHDSQQPWANRDPPHSFHDADRICEVR